MAHWKLVVIGEPSVGKSALCIRYIQDHFVTEYDPTIDDSFRKKLTVDDQTVWMEIHDTAYRDDYAAMREQDIRQAEGFLIVYSIASRKSFEALPGYFEQVLRVKLVDTAPIVLAGNMCDLEGEKRAVTALEGQELAKKFSASFFETSAKDRTNLDESFEELIRLVISKYGNTPPDRSHPSTRTRRCSLL